ncbi:hypothetical protein [Flavihumibacter petaseus]|uniref:Uncharacterized protein n=1 Tax=Flavihumibacter petaseus NBRC 106054 TaxID=1220578 RepID=A0A0E9N417_9BACT|nr:hypothetical protein [Flavihumibacter petaseus]GAO44727.1 hypothetical protein FPE01S_03_07660 [Flavihumibacter petaseus NBRC 106054]
MIVNAEITDQPKSGQYPEKIYDFQSAWNSQAWTFVRFTKEDCSEWCGHFRGAPRHVAISKKSNTILVLTSHYLFQLGSKAGELINLENHSIYQNLTVDPEGNFVLADYFEIEIIRDSIKYKEKVASPIAMDMIQFEKWINEKLEFTCDAFLNWHRHLTMTYNSQTGKIEIQEESY